MPTDDARPSRSAVSDERAGMEQVDFATLLERIRAFQAGTVAARAENSASAALPAAGPLVGLVDAIVPRGVGRPAAGAFNAGVATSLPGSAADAGAAASTPPTGRIRHRLNPIRTLVHGEDEE